MTWQLLPLQPRILMLLETCISCDTIYCSGRQLPQAVLLRNVVQYWHNPCVPKQVVQFYGIFQIMQCRPAWKYRYLLKRCWSWSRERLLCFGLICAVEGLGRGIPGCIKGHSGLQWVYPFSLQKQPNIVFAGQQLTTHSAVWESFFCLLLGYQKPFPWVSLLHCATDCI